MKSVKLEEFREKMIEQIIKRYPDYKIAEYFNTNYSCIRWFGVFDYDNSPALRVAEVIAVERFSSNDPLCDSLLIIDYVNSDSRRYDDIEQALLFMESILIVASDRKKASRIEINVDSAGIAIAVREQQENQVHLESLRDDNIITGSVTATIDSTKFHLVSGRSLKIKDVIFNNPATVVFWGDGEKTIVQCQNGEEFDPEKGLAMAISKKIFGNKYNYYDVFKKWVGKYNKKKSRESKQAQMEITPEEIIRDGHRYVLADDEQESVPDENPREGTNFNDYLNEQLKDPEFKKQFENTEVLKPYCDTSKENDNEQ